MKTNWQNECHYQRAFNEHNNHQKNIERIYVEEFSKFGKIELNCGEKMSILAYFNAESFLN